MEDSNVENKKFCECECGSEIPVINKLGKPARFKHGHNACKMKGKKICAACDSTETQIHNGRSNWHIHDGYRLCHNCYSKYVFNSITNAKWRPINNRRKINPRGKGQIRLKENPRKGICSWCGAIVGISCKRTCMHHFQYHDDPLKDTIELCNSCHKREHDRIRSQQHAEHMR